LNLRIPEVILNPGHSSKPRAQDPQNVQIQALTPWAAVLTVAALAWVTLVVTAPMALSRGRLPGLTLAAYQAGALVCHQRPDRSVRLAGVQMPVCARCFGLYAAGAAGVAFAWFKRRRLSSATARLALAVGAAPIVLTVALEWTGAIATTNVSRMLTGLPLGFAAGLVVIGLLKKSG